MLLDSSLDIKYSVVVWHSVLSTIPGGTEYISNEKNYNIILYYMNRTRSRNVMTVNSVQYFHF